MRYFCLILCLSAVQQFSFSVVKSTAHPKKYENKTDQHYIGHEYRGTRKPQSPVKHFQNEKLSHVKDGQFIRERHVRKDGNVKEERHLRDENMKERKHIQNDKEKDRRQVKYAKGKDSTLQNSTRNHLKEMRHFQNGIRGNLNNDKSKFAASEKNSKPFGNETSIKQHNKRMRSAIEKRSHGNNTLHKRKHKESRHHKTKHDKSKPDFRAHDSDSTEELWPEEWDNDWMQKKLEALNSTQARGDVINMAGARPWAFPCGDPNQHDLPWGTCMRAVECDAEYRIYRGDSFCGRTSLVCCALMLSNYDFNNGIDISFGGTSFSSSDEDYVKANDSKEIKKRFIKKTRAKRKQERAIRKMRMQRSIRSIIQEIKTILKHAYNNRTLERKNKVDRIREYIKRMKKQYRQERMNLIKLHHEEQTVLDEKFQSKLNQVRGMNEAFMTNDTFMDIIVNGTVNKSKLMSLLRDHPQLRPYFKTRRLGNGEPYPKLDFMDANSENREYDVEYGVLYY
ncbi:hypothetical protein HF086_013548 [Spodoptera exigua]|uniref:Uncharacterized protein n=1 Tax=Spodoptera exigua TaxID=7107 RepID=A0A922MUE4_SPOEX|nr:hypothetical protein HF086_013548 [Spodoptera exigua]